jgi:hypothetical protein
MIILTYLNKLVSSLYDKSIPNEENLALALFIFCVILLLSSVNTITYFIILVSLDNKTIQKWTSQLNLLVR